MISRSMHQKYLEPLSCKEGALALFSSSTEPIPKTILLWFSRAFLRVASGFQTPAREAGWVKVHRGCVCLGAGDEGGTCVLRVPRSSSSEIRGAWE